MQAQDIIESIRTTTTNLTEIIDVLEDGSSLLAIGVTDEDQEAVEEAHAEIKEQIKCFNRFKVDNGGIEFEGKSYALVNQAELSNRVFHGWWGDASDGEQYTTEWSAPVMGEDGFDYIVVWQFDETKGAEPEDTSCYDWDSVYDVKSA